MRKTLASAGALLSVGALALTGCTPNTQASSSSSASGSAASDGVINVTASDRLQALGDHCEGWQGDFQGQERGH